MTSIRIAVEHPPLRLSQTGRYASITYVYLDIGRDIQLGRHDRNERFEPGFSSPASTGASATAPAPVPGPLSEGTGFWRGPCYRNSARAPASEGLDFRTACPTSDLPLPGRLS